MLTVNFLLLQLSNKGPSDFKVIYDWDIKGRIHLFRPSEYGFSSMTQPNLLVFFTLMFFHEWVWRLIPQDSAKRLLVDDLPFLQIKLATVNVVPHMYYKENQYNFDNNW